MRENRTSGLMSGERNRGTSVPPRLSSTLLKRQKNDAADAEALVEAAQRPAMRFVQVKSAEQQSWAIVFRVREQAVNQRTELVNALRGHLYEFGYVAPQGIGQLRRLAEVVEDENSELPDLVRGICGDLLDQISRLTGRIGALNKQISALSNQTEKSRLLQSMPGVGPIAALAVETLAPPMEVFKCGRAFSAWLGLVPLQRSTGGKPKLGRIPKMGQRDIRRLLIMGAMAVVRWASEKSAPRGSWLGRMLATKPKMLVAIALANQMARGIWAMLTKQEAYRVPAAAPA
jgi:transposase